ncbi:MAG: flagellar hook basal-body protein [Candidatus Gastranaerophilales bacterium]|nr:flagellar hook basal-body protein [Candidatus Gastranaerophilales bacterium]
MTTFQGLIRKNIINANVQFEKLGYITNNLANQNTTGYKAVKFEQILTEDGYLDGVTVTDHRPAKLLITDDKFNIGINGQGYVPVTSPNGDVKYTRDGTMKQNSEGYLVTLDGYLIGDGIKLPINYNNFWIKENGDVMVTDKFGDKPYKVGTIPLVNFQNPNGLKSVDGNKYLPTAESGEPVLLMNHDRIHHQKLETSNEDIVADTNRVMRLNASMIASFQLLKAINDMYDKTIRLQQ